MARPDVSGPDLPRKASPEPNFATALALIEMAATILPEKEKLEKEWTTSVLARQLLDDKPLWRAALTHLSARSASRMERLHDQQRNNKGLCALQSKNLTNLIFGCLDDYSI